MAAVPLLSSTRGGGEWVSLAGLRTDGRRPHEIRRLRCTLGAQANADGSAYLEQGQTRVLAVVSGPHEVERRGDALHDRALLECSLFHAPFAGFDRKRRRATDRGSLEMALAVKQTFEAAVMRKLYPRTQMDIQLYVLQTDGSLLPALINATSLALADAGIAMQELVAACSVALLDDQPVLDVNYREQSSGAGAYLPLAALPKEGAVVLAQCESRLDVGRFQELLEAGMGGARQVSALLEAEVREHTKQLAGAKLAQMGQLK